MIAPPRAPRRPAGTSRGLSIVELMVGITISLFILAGATMVLTSQLGDNRRLLLETQVQQDLRAAADMIARDVRRAGYWAKSYCQVQASQLPPPPPYPECTAISNPYQRMVPVNAPAGTASLVYDRSTDEEGNVRGTDDNAVSAAERVGFRLNGQTIEVQISDGNWQALTDPTVLVVTQFNLLLNARAIPVPCGVNCPTLGPGGCPLVQTTRDVSIVIVGQAAHDARVQRSMRDSVRLRNDDLREVCP